MVRLAEVRLGDAGRKAIIEFTGERDRDQIGPAPRRPRRSGGEGNEVRAVQGPADGIQSRGTGRRWRIRQWIARLGEPQADAVIGGIVPPSLGLKTIRSSGLLQKGISRSMSVPAGFDFTRAMRLLCEDVALRLPHFAHVRVEEIAITFAQTRRRVSHGLQAKLTPLRFEKGGLVTRRGGRTWTLERLYEGEREMLYILTFYLPRFLDHSFREKLITVFHELYHISPLFDGDIRRMDGRYHVHTHSQQEYDREMDHLVGEYLRRSPPAELVDFLKLNFRGLWRGTARSWGRGCRRRN